MITFKDLIIQVDDTKIDEFVGALSARVANHNLWERKEDGEESVLGVEKYYRFQRNKDSHYPSAGLSIFPKDGGKLWYVPNVVPIDYGKLSYQDYNGILTEFYDCFINPVSKEFNIESTITSGNVDGVDILGIEAERALSVFSLAANKSTGSSHPCDRERWLEFIYKANISGKHIDIGLLERLLLEQGWDSHSADKLIMEFEFGTAMVEYIKEQL